MKFREPDLVGLTANPVFPTDRSMTTRVSPYVYVSNGVQAINTLRMMIERLFGMFFALFRFFISRTWIEHEHEIANILETAVVPSNANCNHHDRCGHDPVHRCHIWCVDYSDRITLNVAARLTDLLPTWATRDILSDIWGQRLQHVDDVLRMRRIAQEELFEEELGLFNN